MPIPVLSVPRNSKKNCTKKLFAARPQSLGLAGINGLKKNKRAKKSFVPLFLVNNVFVTISTDKSAFGAGSDIVFFEVK